MGTPQVTLIICIFYSSIFITCTGHLAAASLMQFSNFLKSTPACTCDVTTTLKTSGAKNSHEPQLIHPGSTFTFFIHNLKTLERDTAILYLYYLQKIIFVSALILNLLKDKAHINNLSYFKQKGKPCHN